MHRAALAVFLLPGALAAQAILQQGIAATSGTLAGAVLGKQLSNALDKVKIVTEEAGEQGGETAEELRRERKRDEWKRLAPKGGGPASPVPGALSPVPGVPAAGQSAVLRIGPGMGSATGSAPSPRSRRSRPVEKPLPSIDSVSIEEVTAARAAYRQAGIPVDTNATDLMDVGAGTERSQVIEKLGMPVARVTIPEEGQFVEVYYYHAKGEPVGAVRLTNGAVTQVQLSR